MHTKTNGRNPHEQRKHLLQRNERDGRGAQTGQHKAPWAASVSRGNEEPELDDFLWEREVSDFIATLRAVGIESFTITDRSTGLMENLHAFAAEGCTMEGLCMVGRTEPEWGHAKPEAVMGIRFKVN